LRGRDFFVLKYNFEIITTFAIDKSKTNQFMKQFGETVEGYSIPV
jgi:hypothetical protein